MQSAGYGNEPGWLWLDTEKKHKQNDGLKNLNEHHCKN